MITVVGIDVGATYTKALALDEDKNIIGRSMVKTGFNLAGAAERGYAEVLGLDPPTAGCAWQLEQLLLLNRGPSPLCAPPVTDSTS